MIKLLLCCLAVVLCGFIGYGLSSYYISRKNFFFCFSNFLNEIKSEIGFENKNLQQIIEAHLKHIISSKDFAQLLTNFLNCLKNNSNNLETLFNNIKILSEEEQQTILHFFKKLGKTNVFHQIEDIDKAYVIVGKYLDMAKDDSKKYGGLFVKLGIIIGLFIVILII